MPLLLTEAVGWTSVPEWCRHPSFCLLFAYFFFFLKLLWSFVSIRSGLCEHFWLVYMICVPINAAAGHADVYANKHIIIIIIINVTQND